jgi:hypothetical protein
MNNNAFVTAFCELATDLFIDRSVKEPQEKAEIWLRNIIEGMKDNPYGIDEADVLNAMRALIRSEQQFLNFSHLYEACCRERQGRI